MKIIFISNYLNHHQIPFCQEMFDLCSGQFSFIAMEPMAEERKNMGWDLNYKYEFEIKFYECEKNRNEVSRLIQECDVVIYGGGDYVKLLHSRIKSNKLTFFISERVYKNGLWRVVSPRGLYYMTKNHARYRKNKIYLLSAGAYTPYDYSLVNAYRNKCFKWAYFPSVYEYDIDQLIVNKERSSCIELLWVSRLIPLKHPEKILSVAKRLLKEDINFHLNMIGIGPLEEEVKRFIYENQLDDKITLCGSLTPNIVRSYMEKANIFVFNSDYREGWGAVVNEAMNSGCAVVASHSIGAVPYLIENNENGLIYKDNSFEDLYFCIKRLIFDKNLRLKLGKNAYMTIYELWNSTIAAQRIYDSSLALLNNQPVFYDAGPMSNAPIIPQRRMYDYVTQKVMVMNRGY